MKIVSENNFNKNSSNKKQYKNIRKKSIQKIKKKKKKCKRKARNQTRTKNKQVKGARPRPLSKCGDRIKNLPLKTIFMPGVLFAKAEDYSVQPRALHTPTVRFVRYLTPII